MFDWQYWLVTALWILWEFYWGYSARGVKRAASKEPLPSRLLGLVLCFLFLLAPEWIAAPLARPLLPQGGFFYYLGLAVLIAGMAFSAWALQVLGRNWSGRVTIKEDHELVTRGPYAWVRHPIYTGALLAIAGTALAYGRIGGLISIGLILAVFLRKIHLEEKAMGGHFGEKYAEYRRRTKTLIPYIC